MTFNITGTAHTFTNWSESSNKAIIIIIMGTNEGWPEAFGFSVIGGAPVMIGDVEEGGSAQQAGLQLGDFIVELDEEPVERWSKEEVCNMCG